MSRHDYECPDIERALNRQIRALVKRAAEGDLEAISTLDHVAETVQQATIDAARALHTRRYPGRGGAPYSWAEIGRELGITRQAAQIRFGEHETVTP